VRLILLGSGAVRPDLERWGPGQVVQVGAENLLFDCGRGASMRLVQAGIPLESLRRVFFTHHHYDHNCDFPYLFLTGWVLGRNFPVEVYGPRGTEAFCAGLFNVVYREDIASRRDHPLYSAEGWKWQARDVLEKEWTLDGGGWLLRAVHVIHKSRHLDNLAFRIESGGRRLVIAGDNTVCDSLMDLAEGADLLVHECSFPSERLAEHAWNDFHTPPRELGKWAKARGVKRLLLKHFCVQPGVAVEPMVEEVREGFGSEGLIVGRDLMSVEV
jgi:ribonuclease Z